MQYPHNIQGKTKIIVILFKQDPLIYEIVSGRKEVLLFFLCIYQNVVKCSLWEVIKIHDFPFFL